LSVWFVFLGYKFYGNDIVKKVGSYFTKKETINLNTPPATPSTIKPSEQILSVQESFEKVAETVLPSVVNIYTEQRVKVTPRFDFPFGDNPFFRDFLMIFYTPKKGSITLQVLAQVL